MAEKEPLFDANKVSEFARTIEKQVADILQLREAKRHADDELRSAETRLANLQNDFTRLVMSQLDTHNNDLRQRVHQSRGLPA